MADGSQSLVIAVVVVSLIAFISNCLSVFCKCCRDFSNPKLWKYSYLYQDFAFLCLTSGLVLLCAFWKVDNTELCDAAGFFLLFGIFLCTLSYLTTGVILLSVQNPGKPSSSSHFHRNIVLVIILPEIIIGAVLSFLPFVDDDLFDNSVEFDVQCFPIRDHGNEGAAYGTSIIIIWWILTLGTLICDVILVLKLWKFNNRINSAQNNVWQTQLVDQGKDLVKVAIVEHLAFFTVLLLSSVTIYSEVDVLTDNSTWIVVMAMAVVASLHGTLTNVNNVMWSSCCCRANSPVQEPHRKLKKLELIKIEAPGKLRMKATWNIGKHVSKRGLMKVYGVNHLKGWAQEIVMLGMLRRAQHPSLIQCLWTNSSNPYYETMTLISGEIITSDSRIICLELTNGGTLQEFIQKAELPLPEQCQRMIIHDIAEGLFYLHHENILHNKLSSACIYLKGSLQSMVLRAAVGDFEDAQIYGTLQQSLDSSIKDKRYFFLPDIRSFALIALEMVSKMCEKKFQNRYVNYNSDDIPMKINLENNLSDEEDEFGAQYCYEAEDTHRMFDSVQPDELYDPERCMSPSLKRQDSLDNLYDKTRPMSPNYATPSRTQMNREGLPLNYGALETEDNEEVAKYFDPTEDLGSKIISKSQTKESKNNQNNQDERPHIKVSRRKSRKDLKRTKGRPVSPNDNLRPQGPLTPIKAKHRQALSPPAGRETVEKGRCASPDPMKDEMLQELRKETKENTKLKKKFSFSRKKSDDALNKNGQAFEAFVTGGDEKLPKRKDWLSKPTSVFKSITSNDTTVSVFKAKSLDDDNHLDAIQEEEIHSTQSARQKAKARPKDKAKAEVWDIIDEQFYTQVNKKAMGKLKKTVSGESRSSLWSFISTQEDMDEEDLDDILECLPGMTEPSNLPKSEITVQDIMAEKDKATRKDRERKRFSYKDLPHSKFELIDYYELLKSKQITLDDVPEDKREMLLNVVELKREDKLRREGKFVVNGAIGNDEMYDNGMNPSGGSVNPNSPSKGNVKVVSFRNSQCHSSPHRNPAQQQERDPRLDRARSAPLKRPRTPMKKPPVEKPPEINPAFVDNRTINVAKRNRARSALKRALSKNNSVPKYDNDRTPTGEKQDLALKYATIRKINVTSASQNDTEETTDTTDTTDTLTVPVPTSESFSVTTVKSKATDIKRYSSFSSNESGSSLASSHRQRKADVSLTSGELSSLSSQAESDHYETDAGHLTDIEGPSKNMPHMKRKLVRGQPSRADSGFDSGSVSSEMSDAYLNRGKGFPQNAKGGIGSWARNYKMVDSVSASPYNFSGKFLPPVDSLPEDSLQNDTATSSERSQNSNKNAFAGYSKSQYNEKDSDSGISEVNKTHTSNNSRTGNPKFYSNGPVSQNSRPMSPNGRLMSPNGRPMSPNGRPMSPNGRPMSPNGRPMSPNGRPMSPPSRPMSPNVRPTDHPSVSKLKSTAQTRPWSPRTRALSPPTARPTSPSVTEPLPTARVLSPRGRTLSPEGHASKGHGSRSSRSLSPLQSKSKNKTYNEHSKGRPPKISVDSVDTSTGIGGGTVVETPASQASKRYRELVKQGVPLRASVIDASPSREGSDRDTVDRKQEMTRPGTAESAFEEPVDDEELFDNLQSKGFFVSRSRSPSPGKGRSPQRNRSPNPNDTRGRQIDRKRRKGKNVPLDQIVRENPEGTPNVARAHRSQSNNHLIVSEDAFLNQPTSEDSETCSIKTNKSNTSSPSGSKPKVVVDAELVIDRIFSQNQPDGYELDVEVEEALGLGKDPFKTLKQMYSPAKKAAIPNLDGIPLLNGVTQRHIHECMELATNLHVITVRDLLPAKQESFDIMRNKLQQVGQLGTVGNQLLDIIHTCWLQDMPPSAGDLVEQLTDPVTETEV